jgi:glycosyltransferase involved in cell wall biosynthesis
MGCKKVSVVVPTFNRRETLKDTLNSLFNQTYPKDQYEIIICDDVRSKDGTEEMVQELMKTSPCELKYLKVRRNGPAAARNVGIENARGEIIGFTDDDCIASPKWIENAIPLFADETISGVQGCTVPLKPSLNRNKLFWKKRTNEITEQDDWYATCNIFYRKKSLTEIGGFDPRFFPGEDSDLAWSLLDKGHKIIFSRNVLVSHETIYISLLHYLKTLKKLEIFALFVKKHPTFRKKMILGFISTKKNLYPIFILLIIPSYLIGISISYALLGAIISYLWARVIVDYNIKMYPLRTLAFIKYFLIDSISLFYTLVGGFRYKCFVI